MGHCGQGATAPGERQRRSAGKLQSLALSNTGTTTRKVIFHRESSCSELRSHCGIWEFPQHSVVRPFKPGSGSSIFPSPIPSFLQATAAKLSPKGVRPRAAAVRWYVRKYHFPSAFQWCGAVMLPQHLEHMRGAAMVLRLENPSCRAGSCCWTRDGLTQMPSTETPADPAALAAPRGSPCVPFLEVRGTAG